MTNEPQEAGLPAPDTLNVALLEGLHAVSHSIEARSPLQLYYYALHRWTQDYMSAVITVMGEPTAGKSTLSSNLVALAAYHLARLDAGKGGSRPLLDLMYIAYEPVRDAAYELGLVPRNHGPGQRTPEDFQRINDLCTEIVSQALRHGGLIILELPAMIMRGDSTVERLALHQAAHSEATYDVLGIWLIQSMRLSAHTRKVRRTFEAHPDQKLDALRNAHVTVEIGEQGGARISGAGTVTLRAFEHDLFPALYTLRREGVSRPWFDLVVRHPSVFRITAVRARYVRECYAPYMMRSVFRFPEWCTAICENRAMPGVTLHQRALDTYEYVDRLRREGRLRTLAANVT